MGKLRTMRRFIENSFYSHIHLNSFLLNENLKFKSGTIQTLIILIIDEKYTKENWEKIKCMYFFLLHVIFSLHSHFTKLIVIFDHYQNIFTSPIIIVLSCLIIVKFNSIYHFKFFFKMWIHLFFHLHVIKSYYLFY